MKCWQLIFFVATIFIGTACASPHLETRAYINKTCPIADLGKQEVAILPVLIEAIAPTLIEKSVDFVASMITTAGQDSTSPAQAAWVEDNFYSRTNGELTLNPTLGCMTVVRGEFDSSGKDVDSLQQAVRVFVRTHQLISKPGFILEMRFEQAPDKKHFRLKPVTVIFNSPIDSALFSSDTRSVGVAVTFSKPGAADKFASGAISLIDLNKGDFYIENQLAFQASQWMAFYPEDDETKGALAQSVKRKELQDAAKPYSPPQERPRDLDDKKLSDAVSKLCNLAKQNKVDDANCPVDFQQAKKDVANLQTDQEGRDKSWAAQLDLKNIDTDWPPKDIELGPFRIDIAITETTKGSALMKFFGDVVSSSKDTLKTDLKNQLPSEKAKADAAKMDAQEVLDKTALDAKIAVEKKQIDIDAQSDPNIKKQLELDLVSLKFVANSAARKADQSEPYP